MIHNVSKAGAHAGFILLAEPTGKDTTINYHFGQSMLIRPTHFYENIFKDLGLEIVAKQDYDSYPASKTYYIHAERVWLLQERLCTSYSDARQERITQLLKKNYEQEHHDKYPVYEPDLSNSKQAPEQPEKLLP